MAYSAEADINAKISAKVVAQLTDDTGGITTDSTNVTAAITNADAVINGYLQAQYTIPLSSTPELIKQLSIDLTVYNLYTRRENASIPDDVSKRREQSLKTLEKINQNKLKLPLPDEFANTAGVWASSKSASDKVYDSDWEDTY